MAEQSIKRAVAALPEDALCQKLLGDCLAEQVRLLRLLLRLLLLTLATGVQGKSRRKVPNCAQCAVANRSVARARAMQRRRSRARHAAPPLARALLFGRALTCARAGEDRKLAVKALASILKGLGLHHEAAAVVAKN